MIEKLTSEEVRQFILANENTDPFELSLRQKEVHGIPIEHIANQIAARKKAKTKLPEWHQTEGLVWPPLLSMEQCSSELTAKNKSAQISGGTLIDLTGGTGIDTYYLSKSFKQVIYIEQNKHLCEIAEHNFSQLGARNIQVVCQKAEDFLETHTSAANVIYIDPARRDDNKNKVFRWADCTPNIVDLESQLLKYAERTLVKASPMLDISASLADLPSTYQIEVVSLKNECKEVLYFLSNNSQEGFPVLKTKNILSDGQLQEFNFSLSQEQQASAKYSLPLSYLYEPNTSVMKAGAFKILSERLSLYKLHQHTHLYTSEHLITDFPGRIFKVMASTTFNKKALKKHLSVGKANIAVRNYPEDVATLRKKTGLKPGGDIYIFGATDIEEQKIALITEKVTV